MQAPKSLRVPVNPLSRNICQPPQFIAGIRECYCNEMPKRNNIMQFECSRGYGPRDYNTYCCGIRSVLPERKKKYNFVDTIAKFELMADPEKGSEK